MRVLLAIDDSNHSRAAVDVVLSRRWPAQTQFRIVNVVEETVRNAADQLVDRVRSELQSRFPSFDVTSEILSGSPKEMILNASANWNANLVVMGSRGMRGIKRVVLGSVSQAVLLGVQGAILIVAADSTTTLKHKLNNILVAVDDSIHSSVALKWLKQFPHSADTNIRLLTVSPPLADKFSDGISLLHSAAYEHTRSQERQSAEALLLKSATAFGFPPGDFRISLDICSGDPAEQILSLAGSWPADLIVVGSRGLKGMPKLWLGSVSQEVVLQAPCPVEVVKEFNVR